MSHLTPAREADNVAQIMAAKTAPLQTSISNQNSGGSTNQCGPRVLSNSRDVGAAAST